MMMTTSLPTSFFRKRMLTRTGQGCAANSARSCLARCHYKGKTFLLHQRAVKRLLPV